MDGNALSKRVAKFFGIRLRTLQQSFVVPCVPGPDGDITEARELLVKFMRSSYEFFGQHGLQPTLYDVLFVPQDLPFRLSASAERAGFVVSYAFETNRQNKKIKQAFSDLTDVLHHEYGGRVYLVKNVFAKPETVRAMYASHAPEFFALKAELDPQGILRNAFLDGTFGGGQDGYANGDGADLSLAA
jgi:decaprenylphospho-beta-D-ribofuranose 2-oxidase